MKPRPKLATRATTRPGRSGLAAEFFDFMRHNKKWWITPIAIVLLAIGALVVLGGSGAAPFIYTLF